MKKLLIPALCFIAVLLNSCDVGGNSDNCVTTDVPLATTEVTGPTTAAVNQKITLEVSFDAGSDCGAFEKFTQENTDFNEITILINAIYDGCSCEAQTNIITVPYVFKGVAPGVYLLKFRKAADDDNDTTNDYVFYTITVS